MEDRVKSLEDLVNKLVTEVNKLKSPKTEESTVSNTSSLDASVTELKARVAILEKATPAPQASVTQSTVYIPMGATSGLWSNADWLTVSEYQVSLDPSSYPG